MGRRGCSNTRTPGNRYANTRLIPVPVPIAYDELGAVAVKGKSVGAEVFCPQCEAVGTLVFTGSWVERGVVVQEGGGGALIPQVWRVVLARCGRCRARLRVLPRELLAFKSFSLPVIEHLCGRYVDPDPQGPGLRRTVWSTGQYAPAHSTLWRWLAGLGERALDRWPGGRQGAAKRTSRACTRLPPVAALITESARRLGQGFQALWQRHFRIPDWKHQSERRREQLEACARVLAAARRLFPEGPHPLCAWHGWLIDRFHVAAWAFPTGMPCTSLELPPPGSDALRSEAKSKPRKKGRCHEARAPPRSLLAF